MAENLQIYDTDFYNVQGFKVVDENQNILTLEKVNNGDFFDYTKPVGALYSEATSINLFLSGHTGITSIILPNATFFSSVLQNCTSLTNFYAPELTAGQVSFFAGCSNFIKAFLPKCVMYTNSFSNGCTVQVAVVKELGTSQSNIFRNNSHLKTVDITGGTQLAALNTFSSCPSFTTLILRNTVVYSCGNVNYFNSTPFASNGSGGTIYIPKVLYDHLGDGTQYDYKAATNWSTLDGYGTITWAQIQGSYYETHYAEGTQIPTE